VKHIKEELNIFESSRWPCSYGYASHSRHCSLTSPLWHRLRPLFQTNPIPINVTRPTQLRSRLQSPNLHNHLTDNSTRIPPIYPLPHGARSAPSHNSPPFQTTPTRSSFPPPRGTSCQTVKTWRKNNTQQYGAAPCRLRGTNGHPSVGARVRWGWQGARCHSVCRQQAELISMNRKYENVTYPPE
jgi:hypothetical protein